jgi:hypothetical protein
MSEELEEIKGAFQESLLRNNKKIRADRAESIVEDAETIYKRKVEDLRLSIKRKTRDRENMLDLSPDTAMSLKVASDFDAIDYVEKDAKLSLDIRNESIKLELAIVRYKHLFGKEI